MHYPNICIKFSYLNWIIFKWWNLFNNIKESIDKNKKQKIKRSSDENFATRLLLESIQRDIDSLKKKAASEVEEAKNIMEGVIK